MDLLHIDPYIVERILEDMNIPEIKVKYHVPEMTKLKYNEKGNFFDLRASKRYEIKKGQFLLIDLGVSIKLPEGYWAQVVPRSSLFANHRLVQTNSFGVIDTTYCGEDDHWKMPVYALDDTIIEFDERICQFRIVKDNYFTITEVDHMEDESRGGFGSTGKL
jgi:dUTP pyrophosphatase